MPQIIIKPKICIKWNVKFLGALHSLKHNDGSHLERRAFLCTHFSLHYSQSAVLGEPQVLETLRSPVLIQSARWRGLTQRGLFYWDGGKFERPSQFSVGGWVGASNSKILQFWTRRLSLCICDLRDRMCVALISVLYYWKKLVLILKNIIEVWDL